MLKFNKLEQNIEEADIMCYVVVVCCLLCGLVLSLARLFRTGPQDHVIPNTMTVSGVLDALNSKPLSQ